MTWAAFAKWARQPTNIHAFGVIAAGVAGAIAQLAGHDPRIDAVCAVVVYVATHLAINDNSADPSSVEKLVEDAVTAIVQNKVNASIPVLTADVEAAVASLNTPKPTTQGT